MVFEKQKNDVVIRLDDSPAINFCKPAVDPMMQSAVDIYGSRVLGLILTGMGSDELAGGRSITITSGPWVRKQLI